MNAKQNQRISNCEAESKDIGCMFNSRSIGPSYCDEPRETKCKEILLWYINCAVLQHCSILRHLWSQPAQHLRSQNVSSKRTDRRQPLLMLSCFFISIMWGTKSRAPILCRLQTSEPGLHAVSWFAGWKAAKVLSSKKQVPWPVVLLSAGFAVSQTLTQAQFHVNIFRILPPVQNTSNIRKQIIEVNSDQQTFRMLWQKGTPVAPHHCKKNILCCD